MCGYLYLVLVPILKVKPCYPEISMSKHLSGGQIISWFSFTLLCRNVIDYKGTTFMIILSLQVHIFAWNFSVSRIQSPVKC